MTYPALAIRLLCGAVVLSTLLVPVAGAANADVPPGRRFALLIGIDRFVGATRQNFGAVNDVAKTREALVKAGWAAENIRVLTDGAARADDIREGLRWIVERSSPESVNVVHYSGHVKQTGGSEFLWPHDNRFIRDTEVAGQLRQLRGQSWISISGCEAAGFDEGISAPNRLFTASSQADEKSYELVAARHSVFTMLMVNEGILAGTADDNRDGRVSIQEAFRYAAARAPGITKNAPNGPQHPVMAGGGNGTDFFLDPPAATPVAPPARSCGINLLGLCLF